MQISELTPDCKRMPLYWIINTKTKRYTVAEGPGFDGEWKEQHPHTAGADWLDVQAFRVCDFTGGIPYVYDLCRDGMMATLLVDTGEHGPDAVKRAKAELRHNQDVVTLWTLRLRKAA